PAGRITPAGVRHHVTDHLGSVVAVVDGVTGSLYEAGEYGVYGARSSVSGISLITLPAGETLRDHFTGKEDQGPDFGLPYTDFGARHYSPALRRWLTPDPLAEKYYDVSPYAYCDGNPVMMVDEDGNRLSLVIPYYYFYCAFAQRMLSTGSSNITKEVGYAMLHPLISLDVGVAQHYDKWISKTASNFSINLGHLMNITDGPEGSGRNALRHAIWQGIITSRYGSEQAYWIGWAHESVNVDPTERVFSQLNSADTAADIMNNTIGQAIGSQGYKNTHEIVGAVLEHYHSTGLWVVEKKDDQYYLNLEKISDSDLQKALEYLMNLNEYGRKN
ncbi:MAG: RHS repeat-associated core domain-containing protein, partial [Bacteroidales bacterium]|nr:RHS repeat-associated core domain-containing protein [Bacteroidales bacterium]